MMCSLPLRVVEGFIDKVGSPRGLWFIFSICVTSRCNYLILCLAKHWGILSVFRGIHGSSKNKGHVGLFINWNNIYKLILIVIVKLLGCTPF